MVTVVPPVHLAHKQGLENANHQNRLMEDQCVLGTPQKQPSVKKMHVQVRLLYLIYNPTKQINVDMISRRD